VRGLGLVQIGRTLKNLATGNRKSSGGLEPACFSSVQNVPLRHHGSKSMPKASAEREKELRAKTPFADPNDNGERRIRAYFLIRAALAIDRLAVRYEVTKFYFSNDDPT
jgi:hypothetical protein